MLKFEKIPRSKAIGLTLRKKTARWTKELGFALLGVTLFHVAFYFIFSIKTPLPDKETLNLQEIAVVFESSYLAKEVDLTLPQPFFLTLDPPPVSQIPSLIAHRKPLQEELYLGPKPLQKGISEAYVRGPFAQAVPAPVLEKLPSPEEALLSIRSDTKGKIFWFEWLKKTSNPDIDRALEKWVKGLQLSVEAAFSPQTLELRLHP